MAVKDLEDTGLLTRDKKKLKEPANYKVVLLNDDYTTQDFVVEVLKIVFHKKHEEAEVIMRKVHRLGRGVVGVYTWDIAVTKSSHVHALAKENDFPLKCVVEEA